MIDGVTLERNPQKQIADYQAIQTRFDALIRAMIPSQMVDSVVVRNEVKKTTNRTRRRPPSCGVYKASEGDKG